MGNQSENVDDEEQDGSGEDGSSSEEIEDILQRQCASMCEDESSGEEIEDMCIYQMSFLLPQDLELNMNVNMLLLAKVISY